MKLKSESLESMAIYSLLMGLILGLGSWLLDGLGGQRDETSEYVKLFFIGGGGYLILGLLRNYLVGNRQAD